MLRRNPYLIRRPFGLRPSSGGVTLDPPVVTTATLDQAWIGVGQSFSAIKPGGFAATNGPFIAWEIEARDYHATPASGELLSGTGISINSSGVPSGTAAIPSGKSGVWAVGVRAQNAAGWSPWVYYALDVFTARAEMGSSTAEVGTLAITDIATKVSFSGGRAETSTAPNTAWTDPRMTMSQSNLTGLAMLIKVQRGSTGTGTLIGWRNTESGGSANVLWSALLDTGGLTVWNGGGAVVVGAYSALTDYMFAIFSDGRVYGKGGTQYTDWTLLFTVSQSLASTIYASWQYQGLGSNSIDFLRALPLPSPLNSLYGTALVNVTSFTQSLGSELLTNGDFSSGSSGSNPPSWTITGESGSDPDVSITAPNGSAGTGAARVYSSASNFQPQLVQAVLSSGSFYENYVDISTLTSGGVDVRTGGGAAGQNIFTSAGIRRYLQRADGSNAQLLGRTAPTDWVINEWSSKLLTPNAQQTGAADAENIFLYTLPGSPVTGTTVDLYYRIPTGQTFVDLANGNGWRFQITRNAANTNYDLTIWSVSAFSQTSRQTVANIGVTAGLKVINNGNAHDFYTMDTSGVWTKRGSTVSLSTFATGTDLLAMYTSDVTPTRLVALPRTNATVTTLLNRVTA